MTRESGRCRIFKVAALAFALTQVGLIAQTVHIPDPNLEAAIRQALGKPEEDITTADMESLTELIADWSWAEESNATSDLTGLERAINLTVLELDLGNNEVSDLSPLAGLTKLIGLMLHDNRINDISSLAGLTNLQCLDLRINNIDGTPGSPARRVIDNLNAIEGLTVDFEPQRNYLGGTPRYGFPAQSWFFVEWFGYYTMAWLEDVAYGDGKFVAVGQGGAIIRSTDGMTWELSTSGTLAWLRSAAYGGGQFVAVGDTGTVIVSGNGVGWKEIDSTVVSSLYGVGY